MRVDRAAKGHCYQRASELLFQYSGAVLCHGVVIQTKPPHHEMGHAWIEFERYGQRFVVDAILPDTPIRQEQYYRIGKVKFVTRYTRMEAIKQLNATDTYGPWHPTVCAAAHQ